MKLLTIALILVLFIFVEASSRIRQPGVTTTKGQSLERYVGKYPDELFKGEPTLKRRLKTFLGAKYSFFMGRLQVQAPIESVDGFLVARGCMAHSCGVEEAILAINLTDGKLHCGILSDKYGHKIKVFSQDKTHVPSALKRLMDGSSTTDTDFSRNGLRESFGA